MAEIVYNRSIDPQNRKEIEKYLEPYLWLVPKWCQKVFVNLYSASDNDAAIETTTFYDYRRIRINFYSGWLTEQDEVKQMHVVHDLLHGFTSIAIDYAVEQIDNLCPATEAEKFNRSMKQQLTVLCESMTQDLAFAIINKFNERP